MLVQARKGARGPLRLAPGLVLHDARRQLQRRCKACSAQGRALDLGDGWQRWLNRAMAGAGRPAPTRSGGAGDPPLRRDRRAFAARLGLSLNGINPALERAFKVRGAKAVALSINCPGGSPVQSALIAARIRALAGDKNCRWLRSSRTSARPAANGWRSRPTRSSPRAARSSAASAWSTPASASPTRSSGSASSAGCTRPARRRRCSTVSARRTGRRRSV